LKINCDKPKYFIRVCLSVCYIENCKKKIVTAKFWCLRCFKLWRRHTWRPVLWDVAPCNLELYNEIPKKKKHLMLPLRCIPENNTVHCRLYLTTLIKDECLLYRNGATLCYDKIRVFKFKNSQLAKLWLPIFFPHFQANLL
jgi:hypothetical protein